jgi:hypothetical protein
MASNGVTCAFSVLVLAAAGSLLRRRPCWIASASRIVNGADQRVPAVLIHNIRAFSQSTQIAE